MVEGDLYLGTSKSAEGYAARVTFQRAKEEGMDVIGRTLTPPPPRLSGRYFPRLKSCCVVVMLVEHIHVRKLNVTIRLCTAVFPVICEKYYRCVRSHL